ncbi:MAG: hypothetical protein KGD63_05715 [Candidatus Lokiarchaeota archaeon]|nr:hypothetical protein [Candidatus Lokiarchaeota archaeon]
MSNIHIPLDHSDLINVIPKEEVVIYSTLSNLLVQNMTFIGVHVIISSKSFAYIRQYPNKKLDKYPHIEFKYGKNEKKRGYLQRIPLHELNSCYYDNGIKKPKIILSKHLGFGTFIFVRSKNETKEDFKIRRKEFHTMLLPYIISSKKEQIGEMEANLEKYKLKEINKIKKTIEKWTKSLEKEG